MASSRGPKVGADLTMNLVSIPGLKLSEPKANCEVFAIGYGAEAASTIKRAKSIMMLDKSTMTDKDLMSEEASKPGIGAGEPHQGMAVQGSERGIEIALVVELADNSDNDEGGLGPLFLIDVAEETGKKIKVLVIVSMFAPLTEGPNTLIHTGDFILEVNPTTTIRKIKYGVTRSLDICYEDMAVVYSGKFLSDARSVEYYFIENGHKLHLIVETPDQLFTEVFAAFTSHGLIEEKAWFATRGIIHVMHTKYRVGRLDESPAITEEQLLYELEQLDIPDTDDSDDSSADEDDDDLSSDDEDENSEDVSDFDDNESNDDEDESIEDEDESTEDEDKSNEDENESNEDEDESYEDEDEDEDWGEEWEIDEDTANEFGELIDNTHVQIVVHSSYVEFYEWI